jgi:hypothetical protein
MRFIFHNPHESNMYKTPIDFYRRRKKSVEKYSHLIDFFLEKDGLLYTYVDSYNHVKKTGLKIFLPKLFGFYLWALLNRINPFKIKVITDISAINEKDVVFTFLYLNFTNQKGNLSKQRLILNESFEKMKALKAIHFSHFNYNSNYASQNLRKANFDLIIAENDLVHNSPYFQKHFNWYSKHFLVLPFVPKERFKKLIPFSDRNNKAIATGTITLPMDENFIDFFGHSDLHPMRNMIYKQREDLTDYIDSYISPIIEEQNKKSSDKQKKYFSFDIVQKYNEYKMFIVPEEISGLPGIGFVEGIMCGSAFVGEKCKMYSDLGLVDGIHYIGYDGTLVDLISKISYYQSHEKELEQIAMYGYSLISNEYTKQKIGFKLLDKINEIRNGQSKKIY